MRIVSVYLYERMWRKSRKETDYTNRIAVSILKEHLILAHAGSTWGQRNLFSNGKGTWEHTYFAASKTNPEMSMCQMDVFAFIGGTLNPGDS